LIKPSLAEIIEIRLLTCLIGNIAGLLFMVRNRSIFRINLRNLIPNILSSYSAYPRKTHKISAAILLLFIALHMANHLAGMIGQAAHIEVMKFIRPVYRNPFVEPVLLILLVNQVLSGLTMVVSGWRERAGVVAWLQAGSGLCIAAFLLLHVSSVLYGRLVLGLDTDFRFAAAGFHVAGYPLFFAPYYWLAIAAAFTHIGCAVHWSLRARSRSMANAVLTIFCSVGVIFGAFVIAALAGLLYTVDIPASYLRTYQ
jgi:hypothetical protein